MQHGPPRRRRARPVGDVPIDVLLMRGEDLTKGWLLAILEQAPLEAAAGILAADLTQDGPRICNAIVRALADEDDLHRLEAGGALEPLIARIGVLAAARSPDAISQAVDALQGVIWSALRAEMPAADADDVADLAQRLALVSELVRVAALRGPVETQVRDAGLRGGREAAASGVRGRAGREADVDDETAGEPEIRLAPGPPEAADVAPGSVGPTPVHAPDALWIGAIEDEIARADQFDMPLSLLVVELEDSERILAAESTSEATATFGRFAQALRSVVRRKDILALETETRAWIIARDTGRVGALALASRAASAVREARPWRGAPMTVSAGVAVFREDGREASTLIEVAEEAKFAASAAGVPVITDAPPEENGDPSGQGPRLVS